MKYHKEQIEFHAALLKALGCENKRIRKVVLTCAVNEVDYAEITEVIVDGDTLKE